MYEVKLSYYNDSIGDWQEQPQRLNLELNDI